LCSAGTQFLLTVPRIGRLLLIVFMQWVHLHQQPKQFVWQVSRNFIAGCLVPDLSQRARRIAPLPSCKATNHSHSLIEGGELSWAQSLLRPSQELREGTDKWFLKWAELTLRKCKAGFRMSDLKQP
jgi:hypothetical protein